MSQRTDSDPAPLDLDAVFSNVLGYLNLSGGSADPRFLSQLNQLAVEFPCTTSWHPLARELSNRLQGLKGTGSVFSEIDQASSVLEIVFSRLLPAWREFHSDLLFQLDDSTLLNPFFLGRCFEAVLSQGGPWDETSRIVADAIDRLNDYIGYRPLAVLENGRKMTPYDHERFRPAPLYISGAGVCAGPHQRIVEQALELLANTPDHVLTGAHFDLARLDEIAVDMRAYDHDHPVFKRTNYLFGEWDPHVIDNSGYYRRFIIRQIILDALVDWVAHSQNTEEAVFDSGAVLCGTILMASAISGDGPACHDSEVTLTSLLPLVARQRDDFYERLMEQADGDRAARLFRESQLTQQPFGHVRQALNLYLAHYGARQVQHRQLAHVYARMGYAEASREQAAVIPSTSARFECEVQWRITAAGRSVENRDIETADTLLQEVDDLLHRGIDCGAFVDPWNILAYQGNFPLFTAREDSIPDHRVEVLLDLMERLFGVYSQALTEAAAQGHEDTIHRLSRRFEHLAEYWDQFASHVIDDLPKVFGGESLESARHVAQALAEWRAAGEAAGDISFWRKHVDRFTSAKSYACVVEALLARGDHVAAMALLVQWLSVSDEVGIESGPYSIHALLIDWINRLTSAEDGSVRQPLDWNALQRLFDFLEANAGDYWDVPQLDGEMASEAPSAPVERGWADPDGDNDGTWDDDDEDHLFDAAYESMVYRDSTDDGTDGEVLDGGFSMGNTEFEILNRQLEPRIKFIMAIAQLWQIAASALASEFLGPHSDSESASDGERPELSREQLDVIESWQQRVRVLQDALRSLMDSIWDHEIDETGGDHDANVEYDIQLQTKFYLLNTIIATHLNCGVAEIGLLCLIPEVKIPADEAVAQLDPPLTADELRMVEFYRSVIEQDVDKVRNQLAGQFRRLSRKPLLYVPLDNGGHPQQILAAREIQTDIRFLLKQLPRLGLLKETWHVVRLAHRMERESRPTQMAVTEFDRIFRTGLRNTIDCLIESSKTWDDGGYSDEDLITLIEDILSHFRDQWFKHARTMRLSTVEGLRHDMIWDDVRDFITKYGEDLFHARSLTLGNVRTILHNGVDWFLEQLAEIDDPLHPHPLLDALENTQIEVDEVIEMLELVYGSVVDKFDRFLEYNTTTTHSDYGDRFYVLLDFLRVEAAYDRNAWERIPESIVHRSLSQAGCHNELRMLEEIIEGESRSDADQHLEDLAELEAKYGVHLPSIGDRLNERFVKPLAVNRMISLIQPAMQGTSDEIDSAVKFAQLQNEVSSYLQDSAGSAIDVPQWIQDLDREVSRLETPTDYIRPAELEVRVPPVRISEQDVRNQLETWTQQIFDPERARRKKAARRRRKRKTE